MAKVTGNAFNLSKAENASLTIEDMDVATYFLTTFNIPGISIGTIPLANPFKEHNEPGNKLSYDELQAEIMVDEKFDSWKSMYNWVLEASNGYTFSAKNVTRRSGNIMIMTNNMNPSHRISFVNMFPISVGDVSIDMQQAEPTVLTFSVTFQYESYSFSKL